MLVTAFTQLVGCQVPIQQAPMGGVTTPQLAVAISKAGGLSMLEHPSPIPLADRIAQLERAQAGPFGVNFLMPFLDRSNLADVELAARRARLVEFFYGTPDPGLIDLVHSGEALAGWQVGSVAEARQAVDTGCDLIIAQGLEAGGHVRSAVGLLPLLADVLEVVAIPVLAAGGITSARAMAAALAAGAAGVRVGTRFVATQESGAHPDYVAALLAAPAEATVLTETFSVGWPDAAHRVLRSAVAAAQALPDEVVAMWQTGNELRPIPRWFAYPPSREITGHVEAMAMYAGQGVGQVKQVVPAAQVVTELADGAEELLRRWGQVEAPDSPQGRTLC
jgi:NAD(P)H-dependent flavin oxidoreductase YrpB (nitropropane dioxygenase family)